jgi:hypothetical protein
MCGPKFCSMKISHDIKDIAAATPVMISGKSVS